MLSEFSNAKNKKMILNELITAKGHWSTNPLEKFFEFVSNKFGKGDNFRRAFKQYFGEKLGVNISKISDNDIDKYFEYLQGNTYDWKKMTFYRRYSLISEFAYFIAKTYFSTSSSGLGLSYLTTPRAKDEKIFFFFDDAFEIFVGDFIIGINKETKIKGEVWRVKASSAERKLIGMGYGLKMYLTILHNCDYLKSDTVLYEGSYKLWTKTLPKVANVWLFDSHQNNFMKIKPNIDIPNSFDIDYFVASIFNKKILV